MNSTASKDASTTVTTNAASTPAAAAGALGPCRLPPPAQRGGLDPAHLTNEAQLECVKYLGSTSRSCARRGGQAPRFGGCSARRRLFR